MPKELICPKNKCKFIQKSGVSSLKTVKQISSSLKVLMEKQLPKRLETFLFNIKNQLLIAVFSSFRKIRR